MKTLTITLPPDLEQLIEEKIASGEYLAPAEVIHHGLRLIKEDDVLRKHRLEELRREVNIGLEQLDRGEYVEFDPEDLKRRVREKVRHHQNGTGDAA